MDSEVIREENGLRVVLTRDEEYSEPYDDGQSPLLRIDRTRRYAEHVMVTGRPTGDDSRIEEAAVRFARKPALLEKYLRAYHGATQFRWYGPNQNTDYAYVTYDTAEWCEYIGCEEGEALPDGSVNLNEYRAYLAGEVYFYAVEKRVREETVTRELDGTEISRFERGAWETVDSCGGYYGYDYAREAALEAFKYVSEWLDGLVSETEAGT